MRVDFTTEVNESSWQQYTVLLMLLNVYMYDETKIYKTFFLILNVLEFIISGRK